MPISLVNSYDDKDFVLCRIIIDYELEPQGLLYKNVTWVFQHYPDTTFLQFETPLTDIVHI